MKKIIITILSMILMLSMVSATTYYVSTTGNDSAAGTEIAPWATISTHLYGSTHDNIANGDTMFIYNGEHVLQETINDGVYTTLSGTIIGESRDGVIININTTYGFYTDDAALSLYNLTLDGWMVLSSTNRGMQVRDASDGLVINNVIFRNFEYAISAYFNTGHPSNAHINNNQFMNVTRAITLSSYDKFWVNSTFDNNLIDSYYVFGDTSYSEGIDDSNLNITNNVFNVEYLLYAESLYRLQEENNNIFEFDRLRLENVNPEETIEIGGFDIANGYIGGTGNAAMIFAYNSSNIIIKDITFCSAENPCNNEIASPGSGSIIWFSGDADNIVIDNITMYMGVTPERSSGIIGTCTNCQIINNEIITYDVITSGIMVSGNDTIIDNNAVTIFNNSGSYAIGCGSEGLPVSGRPVNMTLSNNIVYATQDTVGISLHTYMFSYLDNSLMSGNIQYGGGYGHVIKGTTNSIIENGEIHNFNSNIGMYEKGGENNIFRNYYISNNKDSNVLQLNMNPTDFFVVTNSSYENIDIDCGAYNCRIVAQDNTTVSLKDVVGLSSWYITHNALALEYYSITIDGNGGMGFTIIDNESNEFDYNIDTYEKTYFKVGEYNSTDYINLSSYSYVASQYDQEESGIFVLNAPYTLTLPIFSRVPQTCATISETVFNAMNLGVIGLIVLVASILVGATMAFGGASFDMNSMKAVIISVIIVSVLFMIGVMIIQMITGAVC